jgi:predicted nucleic acid-binding protein
VTLLIDTGLFYALQNQRANRHAVAKDAFSAVLAGAYGRPYTSDYVYDEAVTLVRQRTGGFAEAKTTGDRIRGVGDFPDAITMLFVTESVFEATIEIFERYDDQSLSFTDTTTIALIEAHGLDAVLSFDDDFDGLVDRLDPATAAEES